MLIDSLQINLNCLRMKIKMIKIIMNQKREWEK